MQTENPMEEKTVFYDRLSLVERLRLNGCLAQVGGDEGAIKVRIQKLKTPILTLHLSTLLVASAVITRFDIVSISDDEYSIHLYLDEYGLHKNRRKYILHFSNDVVATRRFFDTYVSVLPQDIQKECPSYTDLLENGEAKKVKKETEEDDISDDEFDEGDCEHGATMKFQYSNGNTSDCDSSDALDLDEGFFEESQDIYANNCLVSLPKKW